MADGVVSCVVGNEQSEQMLLRLLVDPGCAVDVVGALVGPGFEINSPVPFEPDFCVTIVHTAASAVSPLPLPPRLSTLMLHHISKLQRVHPRHLFLRLPAHFIRQYIIADSFKPRLRIH